MGIWALRDRASHGEVRLSESTWISWYARDDADRSTVVARLLVVTPPASQRKQVGMRLQAGVPRTSANSSMLPCRSRKIVSNSAAGLDSVIGALRSPQSKTHSEMYLVMSSQHPFAKCHVVGQIGHLPCQIMDTDWVLQHLPLTSGRGLRGRGWVSEAELRCGFNGWSDCRD
jgi:hypothetical protein